MLKILLPVRLVIAILLFSSFAQAWGGRGHHSICAAAVHLVKAPELRDFLKSRPHIMGHLCNIPDIYWKSLPSELRQLGDPTHFINAEKLGVRIGDISLDYKKIIADYTGKPNQDGQNKTLFYVPNELGSIWWRADQLYRLSLNSAQQIKLATPPKDSKEEQNNELPYNKAVYAMLTHMGLLGHFVGDASQPFHNTTDYDGYASGHGGIHAYYEENIIAAFGGDLEQKIVKTAQAWKEQKFLKSENVVENMRTLSEISFHEIKEVLKIDHVVTPSTLVIEKGMSIKKVAQRKPATENLKNYEKIALKHLARSSLLLAHLWDQAYKKAGEPVLAPYRSYLYPFTPEFIKPDYLQ